MRGRWFNDRLTAIRGLRKSAFGIGFVLMLGSGFLVWIGAGQGSVIFSMVGCLWCALGCLAGWVGLALQELAKRVDRIEAASQPVASGEYGDSPL